MIIILTGRFAGSPRSVMGVALAAFSSLKKDPVLHFGLDLGLKSEWHLFLDGTSIRRLF